MKKIIYEPITRTDHISFFLLHLFFLFVIIILIFFILVFIVFTRIIIIVSAKVRVFALAPIVSPEATPTGAVSTITSAIVIIITIIIASVRLLLSAKLVSFGRHSHCLGLHRFIRALGARNWRVLLILDSLPPDVILAEANFTSEAGVLAVTVTRQALKILCLNHLTAGLMLELVILTQELETEAAGESPTCKFHIFKWTQITSFSCSLCSDLRNPKRLADTRYTLRLSARSCRRGFEDTSYHDRPRLKLIH